MITPDKEGVFWGRCDFPECDQVFLTDRKNIDDARKTLAEYGWRLGGEGRWFCVAHRGEEVMATLRDRFKDWDHGGDVVDHPKHYGGADNVYEAIKVIEDWQLDFNLGNCVKHIARHRHKGKPLEDLKKARWYLERAITNLDGHPQCYPQETVEEKLRKALVQKERYLQNAQKRAEWAEQAERQAKELAAKAERSRAAYKGQLTRVKNGVCPCCRRSFGDLRRHMKTKHPGYMAEEK